MVRKMELYLAFALASMLMYGLWGFLPRLAQQHHMGGRSILVFETVGTAVVVMAVLISLGFRPDLSGKGIAISVLAGTAGAIGSLLFLMALSRGRTAVVVTLTALYPLVAILLSAIVLKEAITLKQAIGMVLALGAVILFSI
ncbi:MAG: EamA family transporter [Candidatus Thermoplasmatota archaeon]|jgi:transporter family protein|nr:EamA family transporter [Candidatus Thermoplasmatota archaeon]